MPTAAAKTTKSRSTSAARSTTFFTPARSNGAFFAPVQRKAATPEKVQPKLAVSQPTDPLEKEADRTAEKVMRMPAPQVQRAGLTTGLPVVQRAVTNEKQLQRFGLDSSFAAPASSEIHQATSGGEPLSPGVRSFMEPRLGADLSSVRVHADESAHSLSNQLSARAFTYRNHIFFNRDQYVPESAAGRQLLAHELTHTIQQGATVQRAALTGGTSGGAELQRIPQVTTGGSAASVQRLGVSDALEYFADKAYNIPGFRMLTLVIGVNPITMRAVDRSAANLLRALIELVPGGHIITQVLDNHGVVNRAAAWVEAKVAELGDIGAQIISGLDRFIKSLSWSDILDLGAVWDRAKAIFTRPISQLISFGASVVGELLDFVRQAILRPLAALAEGTRGYDLLKAILGQDPITGDPFPRTAETLIGGFMKLIGQEEVWQNLKQGRAVERAFAWFQGALSGLMGFVRSVPQKIVETLRSLTFEDVITVVNAFRKIGSAFLDVASQFGSWALNQVISLLEILFSVVAPGVMPYIAKARAAFQTILRDPIGFVGNLIRAGKLGFQRFASNILTHLKTALIKWLVGPLAEAGVYIPTSFSLIEIVKLVLSVLGLTWQNIRGKLVKIIPEPVLVVLERTAGILVTLVTQGPAAAWEQIKTELSDLKDQLIAQVTQMISMEVVKAAVMKLVSMLNPAGAVVQAIIAIYNTVTFFIEKARQIGAVVASFIDSIAAIASGAVDAAAARVEATLANTLVVVIGFLAKFVGLGGVPAKLVGIVQKVRQPIDRGLDKIVAWLGKMLDKLVSAAKNAAKSLLSWWLKKEPISGGDEPHTLTFAGERESAKLVVRSAPTEPEAFMTAAADKANVKSPDRDKPIATTGKHARKIQGLQKDLKKIDDNQAAAASGGKKSEAEKLAASLDEVMKTLANHIGTTLESWGSKDEQVKKLDIARGSFTVEQKRAIAQEAVDMGLRRLTARNRDGEAINVRRGYARRHVVSAHDMGEHYAQVLNPLKVSKAKLLLEERGSIAEARTPVPQPISARTVIEAAISRYNKFFGYAKNIFLGDSRENSSIQEHLDPKHPEMSTLRLLNDHVARIKRAWALDGSFKETPVRPE